MRLAILCGILFATLTGFVPLSAQDLIVGPVGSGASFTSINAAIQASFPGQRVRVLPGSYAESVLIDRPIELIGSGPQVTEIRNSNFLPITPPSSLIIRNIAAGARVRVDGFAVTATAGTRGGTAPVLMSLTSSPGRIELHDLRISGFNSATNTSSPTTGLLTIQDCAQVTADNLLVNGGSTVAGLPLLNSLGLSHPSGIAVQRSVLWINESTALGTATQLFLFGSNGTPGAGLYARDARVYATNLVATGAESGGGSSTANLGISAPGLRLENSVFILGGARSRITGGNAVFNTFNGLVASQAASAVVADAGATLRYANDVNFIAGAPIAPQTPPNAISADPTALVEALPHRLPTIRLRAMPTALNIPIELEVAGEPLVQHVRVLDFATQPAQEFPGTVGSLVIEVTPSTPIYIIPLGLSGTQTVTAVVPNLPSFVGLQLVEQAAQVLNGTVWLSPPTFTTLSR